MKNEEREKRRTVELKVDAELVNKSKVDWCVLDSML